MVGAVLGRGLRQRLGEAWGAGNGNNVSGHPFGGFAHLLLGLELPEKHRWGAAD
jgi:hypothetical protein